MWNCDAEILGQHAWRRSTLNARSCSGWAWRRRRLCPCPARATASAAVRAESIPPRQAEHDALEPALADIIAQAQHQRLVDRFDRRRGRRSQPIACRRSRRRGPACTLPRSTTSRSSSKSFACAITFPSASKHHAVAVEDQLIIPADLVDIHQRLAELLAPATANSSSAKRVLAHDERARRWR